MSATVIGVFEHEQDAIEAIEKTQATGVDPKHISVLARDEEKAEFVTEETDATERHPASEKAFGILGGFLAGIGGGFTVPGMAQPGYGALLAAGPLAANISGGSYEEVVHMFKGWGMDQSDAELYTDELNQGKIIVLIED